MSIISISPAATPVTPSIFISWSFVATASGMVPNMGFHSRLSETIRPTCRASYMLTNDFLKPSAIPTRETAIPTAAAMPVTVSAERTLRRNTFFKTN